MSVPSPGVRRIIARRSSLREEVAHALRAAVVAGEMRPGAVYSAPALAEQFGISATPVREALLDLAKEGLVEAVRNRGFRVCELSDRDLDEISQVRHLLEPPSIAQVARTATSEDIADLWAAADAIEAAAKASDLITYLEADRTFHLTLLGLLGNQRLVEIVSSLRAQTRLFGLSQLAESGALLASAREHHELLRHIENHDAEAAEHLMRRHIGHVRGIWAARTESDTA